MKHLIDLSALDQLPQSGNTILLDVRAYDAYLEGHIPGAIHADPACFNISKPPVIGLLPDLDTFNATVSALGIQPGHAVVVYDDTASPGAARVVWTLLAFGHESVALLNGGLRAWIESNRTTTSNLSGIQPGSYSGALQTKRIADTNTIRQQLHNDAACIVDARSKAEFDGADVRTRHGGHIPGAVNLNWEDLRSESNPAMLQSDTALQDRLLAAGITPDKEIICYCQSHRRSALMCIVLEHLGYPSVKGYPGSWSEWGNRDDLPIER